MFAFVRIRLYALFMFGDIVRELAPGYGEAPDLAADRSSAWPPAGSAWPDETAVWASGETAKTNGSAQDPDIDLGALNGSELKDLIVELAAERARAEGRYLAAVGELAARSGAQSAAYVLRDQTRMNCSQARAEARLAESLVTEGLTDTLDAMQAGEIHMSHAKVIAREAPKKHRRSEDEFLELSRAYPSDMIARHPLAYRSQQVEADLAAEAAAKGLSPIDAELAMQRQERSASMRMGDDGMWHLRGKFDALTGRQLSIAIQAAVRAARRRNANSSEAHGASDAESDVACIEPTRAQLAADAISDLIAGTPTARRANTSLLIVADYDLTADRLTNPRLDDGTPLSAQMLADHAVDAKVLPAVFRADWSQLVLGRTRNANDAQRLVLAARDGGCIGCRLTSEHTQAHHINHYENGGLTDIANLASLCEPCHRDLHAHHRKIHTPPNGQPQLKPPESPDIESSSRHPTESAAAARSP